MGADDGMDDEKLLAYPVKVTNVHAGQSYQDQATLENPISQHSEATTASISLESEMMPPRKQHETIQRNNASGQSRLASSTNGQHLEEELEHSAGLSDLQSRDAVVAYDSGKLDDLEAGSDEDDNDGEKEKATTKNAKARRRRRGRRNRKKKGAEAKDAEGVGGNPRSNAWKSKPKERSKKPHDAPMTKRDLYFCLRCALVPVASARDAIASIQKHGAMGSYEAPSFRYSVVRVTLINWDNQIVLDNFIECDSETVILDFKTAETGVSARHLQTGHAVSLADVRAKLETLLKGKILIGHDLERQLPALGLYHPTTDIRDTSRYAPYTMYVTVPKGSAADQRKPQEKILCARKLQDLIHDVLGWNTVGGGLLGEAMGCLELYKRARVDWETALVAMAAQNNFPVARNGMPTKDTAEAQQRLMLEHPSRTNGTSRMTEHPGQRQFQHPYTDPRLQMLKMNDFSSRDHVRTHTNLEDTALRNPTIGTSMPSEYYRASNHHFAQRPPDEYLSRQQHPSVEFQGKITNHKTVQSRFMFPQESHFVPPARPQEENIRHNWGSSIPVQHTKSAQQIKSSPRPAVKEFSSPQRYQDVSKNTSSNIFETSSLWKSTVETSSPLMNGVFSNERERNGFGTHFPGFVYDNSYTADSQDTYGLQSKNSNEDADFRQHLPSLLLADLESSEVSTNPWGGTPLIQQNQQHYMNRKVEDLKFSGTEENKEIDSTRYLFRGLNMDSSQRSQY